MSRMKQAGIGVAAALAASLCLGAGAGAAAAESIPASGRYQCTGASGAMAELNFTVDPGTIYTTTKGFRGTMSVHPGTGNVLFHGAPPQASYQGRYSPGPPPQVTVLTVTDGKSVETGIVCQMH
jgi:hypothetical protein